MRDKREVNPSLGMFGFDFAVAHQSAMPHQPTERALDDPAFGQDNKARRRISRHNLDWERASLAMSGGANRLTVENGRYRLSALSRGSADFPAQHFVEAAQLPSRIQSRKQGLKVFPFRVGQVGRIKVASHPTIIGSPPWSSIVQVRHFQTRSKEICIKNVSATLPACFSGVGTQANSTACACLPASYQWQPRCDASLWRAAWLK